MNLLTSRERYDPFHAYAMLYQYPPVILEQIIEGERRRGLLVKAEGTWALDRIVSGTLSSISAVWVYIMTVIRWTWGANLPCVRFLNQLATSFPGQFFVKAGTYNQNLQSHEHTLFPFVDANSGMMACLLNLISQGKVSSLFKASQDCL